MSDDGTLDDALLALAGDEEEAEEGEASDADSPANSLGSGAMDESDSSRDSPDAPDPTVLFPLEGVFRNERDKAEILALPQVKREQILADREEQKQAQNFTAQLARRAKQVERDAQGLDDKRKRKASSADLDDSQRKSSRPKVKSNQPLEAYKRQREQRGQQRERQNDRRNRGRRNSSNSSNNRISDVDAEGESEVEWDQGAKAAQAAREELPPNLNHFDAVRVGRGLFHEVCFYPGFQEAMIGAFCRVGSGQDPDTKRTLYKMAQIKGFSTGKPYGFEGKGDRKVWTDQYAVVQHGTIKKEWPFQFLSNQRFTDADLDTYKRAMAESNLKLATRSFLEQKWQNIKDLENRTWTNADIESKLKLQNQYKHLEVANTKVQPVSASDAAAKRIAEMNERNRLANSESIRKALIRERGQREREQRERAAKRQREKVAAEEAAEAAKAKLLKPPKSNLDDLFEASDNSRAGTPAVGGNASGTSTPAKKAEKKGIPTFKKRAMDDDIISALDFGIEIDF